MLALTLKFLHKAMVRKFIVSQAKLSLL